MQRVLIRPIQILVLALEVLALAPGRCVSQSKPWVTAYYSGWQLGDGQTGYPPVSVIDYTCVTDVVLFSLVPNADGTLDSTSNSIKGTGATRLLNAAHAAGTKVLISIGGWSTDGGFLGATSPSVLPTFVNNMVSYMRNGGFDGIDIDWEPLSNADSTNLRNLAVALRGTIQNLSPRPILTTTCVSGNGPLMASVEQYFDRVNIMTYDMSGNYSGWVSWYNSPLYNGGNKFPGTSEYLPSIDEDVSSFKAAGVPPNKTGIGAELGGTVWQGLTLPLQLLAGLTGITYDVPLYAWDGSGIMQQYYSSPNYHWDSGAQVGYLSVPSLLGLTGDFISYDDSNSIKAKAQYIQKKGLGGIILYELGMGYPGNGSYPLMKSVKTAFAETTSAGVPIHVDLPVSPSLDQNFPNPFNPTTTIRYSIPSRARVRLTVFNTLGQLVAALVDGEESAGYYDAVFDGSTVASGVYFYRLEVGSFVETKKLMLIR